MITDNFQVFEGEAGDPDAIRLRCICGSHYPLAQSRDCPACGRKVPKSVSLNGGSWISHAQWKAESLRRMLSSEKVEAVPAEHRDAMQRNIEKQICQLEDGTWKQEARRRIERLRDMLNAGNQAAISQVLSNLSEENRQQMLKTFELGIRIAQQELEAAGEVV